MTATEVGPTETETNTTSTPISIHRFELALDLRCALCAEKVPPGVILRRVPCPWCNGVQEWSSGASSSEVIERLLATWHRRRFWVYLLVGGGALVSAALPLVASLVTLVGMVVARYGILRIAMRWFSPTRRVAVAMILHPVFLATSLGALVIQEALTLLPGANIPLKSGTAVLCVMGYTESAVWFVANRLRRDRQSPSLDTWEWLLPAAVVTLFIAVAVAVVAVLSRAYELMLALIEHNRLLRW